MIEIHEALIARRGDRQAQAVAARQFEDTYTSAYARNMDWRIDRGTLTEDEVRRISEHTGDDPPDVNKIKQVQQDWREAIDKFVNHRIQERFLNTKTFSQEEWEAKKERIIFVHDRMDTASMKETLGWHIVDKDAHLDQDEFGESSEEANQKLRSALKKLEPTFADVNFRTGFKAVQPQLPEHRRYNFICKIAGDFPADVYLVPEKESDYDDE